MNKKYGVFSSSVDPDKLSLTAKGFILGAIPIIGFIAPLFGFELPRELLESLAEQVGDATVSIWQTIAAIMVIIGTVRKILVLFGIVQPKQ